MSPVAATGRRLVLLLGIALLTGLSVSFPAFAQDTNTTGNETNTTGGTPPPTGGAGASGSELGVPADAPAPAEGKITRVLTVGVIEEGCPGGADAPCFDALTFVAAPGDTVVLHGDFRPSDNIHNLHATEGVPSAPKTPLKSNELHTISFTMPDEGRVRVVCDAHATTMILDVVNPAAAATTGGHGTPIPALGVHFLAYWVGVIAFAILFIVYGLTFFLFKYNETRATTDHWDRSETPAESKRLAAIAPLLAVVIAVAAIAAITFFAVSR